MLKDLINKNFKKNLKKEKADKIIFPVMDGFVDIKGYDKDGNLFYHDCGDNVVSDWMRHSIMMMLAGVAFSNVGDKPELTPEAHSETVNKDGYVFNNKQFLSAPPKTLEQYCKSTKYDEKNSFALFPTKILLGTGKEYPDWATLKSENEIENQSWYNQMVKDFGNGSETTAISKFQAHINIDTDGEDLIAKENDLSGTITNGVQSGDGTLVQCRTVNDPDNTTNNIATSSAMYKNYNVVGAIKTPYKGNAGTEAMLPPSKSESGRLLKPEFRGVGKPCFIYLNQSVPKGEEGGDAEEWNKDVDIKLSHDEGNRYMTKISFTINLPTQDGQNTDKYYPYNGWQLKQIGLYSDGIIQLTPGETTVDSGADNYYPANNMKHGTLLAVKNISPITKMADAAYKITWTLTI